MKFWSVLSSVALCKMPKCYESTELHDVVKIIPRCNNCGLFFANALLYMFRVTFPPIIRSTCAVYGHR